MERIGVALSGGGYRAAAWGLGTLLYLGDARLHDRVVTVSSVSGGSLTNAAVGLTPFRRLEPPQVWALAARLARRFAGDPHRFAAVLAAHGLAWAGLVLGAGLHHGPVTLGALGSAVALSLAGARACGDATFGRIVTWLYCDLLALSVALVAFAVGQGWWWLGALAVAGTVASARGRVVGWAIGRSLLRRDGRRTRLADLGSEVDHVLCACDLHGRHHVYFGRDFVYSFGLGLGANPALPLTAAVQASANLPGAFAPRAMRAGPFRFTGGRYHSPVLALTDGGVYDNMADEWLLGFGARARSFARRAAELDDPGQAHALGEVADRLAAREPDFVVVANASGALGFRFAWTTFLPLLGEVLALLRVKSILYDNGNTTRRRLIVDRFRHRRLDGIIVHIDTDPWAIIEEARTSPDPRIRARAGAVAERLQATVGLDPATTRVPPSAGTVLSPLPRGRIANLLQRSYALACVQGHIWHDLPLVEIPPRSWFEGLEAGRVDRRG